MRNIAFLARIALASRSSKKTDACLGNLSSEPHISLYTAGSLLEIYDGFFF